MNSCGKPSQSQCEPDAIREPSAETAAREISLEYGASVAMGVLQGLTEFLPVSSSGHLAILGALFGLHGTGDGALFEILLHLGSAAAIMIVFWPRISRILRALPLFVQPWRWRVASQDAAFRMAALVLLGSVPAGVVGVLWGAAIEALFDATRFVGGMLIVTGSFLLATRWLRAGTGEVTPLRAVLIGGVQALAVTPGISRSGSTISAALASGTQRELAGEFSFLLGLVAILGANLLEIPKLSGAMQAGGGLQAGPLLAGCLASFVVSWISLRWLLRFIARGQLWVFGPYCLAVGTCAMIWM